MTSVMDLLLDIHSSLDVQQKEMDEMKATGERVPEGKRMISSANWACAGTNRGCNHHRADLAHASQLLESPSLEDLSEEVHERVAHRAHRARYAYT